MKYKYTIIILILSLVGIIIMQYIYPNKIDNNHKELIYKYHLMNQISYCGKYELLPDIQAFKSESHKMELEDIIEGKYKIIFRIKDTNCSTCISMIIKKLRDYSGKINNSDILIWVSQSNGRYSKLLSIDLNFEFPMYTVPYQFIDNNIEDANSPFIFVMTPKLEIKDLYIPEKSMIELLDFYLSNIQVKYFTNE